VGTIYNEKAALVDGATITVKSLDASVPYMATVQSSDGAYVINNVPEGANVEVVVTKDGWTSRRRIQSFQQSATGQRNELNFGGANASDPQSAAYFISDYPEIAATTPEHDERNVDPTRLIFKVTLSEAIDEDSRDAFERNFHLFPVNAAAGGGESVDVEASEKADPDGTLATAVTLTQLPYTLAEGATFLGSPVNKVKATWNAAGTEMTLTFDGALQTGRDEAGRYQAALFNIAFDKIEDAKGNVLGTDAANRFTLPGPNELIRNVFRDPDLSGSTWAATHKSAVGFQVKKDDVDPKLTGVSTVEDDNDLRIEMTFSEPLATYAGSGEARIDETVLNLSNYSFMVGARSGDLTSSDLEGVSTLVLSGPIAEMASGLQPLQEFKFDGTSKEAYVVASGGDLMAFPDAAVAIEVEPDAPNMVNIWIRGGRDLFNGYRTIKARVEGVRDPAGNAITMTDADRNLVTATL
jgi:hypothetical protein